MASIAGVRLSRSEPVVYFDAGALEINVNDLVVIETENGEGLGRIVFTPDQLLLIQLKEPVRPVLRVATDEDLCQAGESLL